MILAIVKTSHKSHQRRAS